MRALLLALALILSAPAASAQQPGAAMPDPRQMSGVPLPLADVPVGTLTVRVVRGSMANPLAGQTVELSTPSGVRRAQTDPSGRAEFTGLTPGMSVKAIATVDGERLESQEFPLPSASGVRLALVATDPEQAKRDAEDRRLASAPAQPGIVVLSEGSRIVVEMGEEALNVFNILEVENTARTPVMPPQPVVFELPAEATSATVLDGSAPGVELAGRTVTVSGPFAPGKTVVQFAYAMEIHDATLRVEQRMPIALMAVNVMAQRAGDLHVTSPQFAQHRDMTANDGQTYIVANGPGLRPSEAIVLEFTGLPHAARWPRYVGLGVALAVLLLGAWGSMTGRASGADARQRLEARRERLFEELAALDVEHRQGRLDPAHYGDRRRVLVAELERIYAQLDGEAAA